QPVSGEDRLHLAEGLGGIRIEYHRPGDIDRRPPISLAQHGVFLLDGGAGPADNRGEASHRGFQFTREESAMNRSGVKEIPSRGSAFIRQFGYIMPPFADWSPAQMRRAPSEAPDIVARRLGWDVTDFGQGDFAGTGLFLFTVRNGDPADLARGRGML